MWLTPLNSHSKRNWKFSTRNVRGRRRMNVWVEICKKWKWMLEIKKGSGCKLLSGVFFWNYQFLKEKSKFKFKKIVKIHLQGVVFNEQRFECLTKFPKILFPHNNYTKKDQGIKLKAEKRSFLNHVVSQRIHIFCVVCWMSSCCLWNVQWIIIFCVTATGWMCEKAREKNQEKITSEAMNFTHTRTHSTIWTNVNH